MKARNAIAFLATAIGLVTLSKRLLQKKLDLHDKVVLITGGSRGLGLAIAEAFASQGAKLVLCARNEEELQQAHQHFSPSTSVLTIQCDVTDPAQVQQMITQSLDHFGHINILVNNAGIISAGPLRTQTREDFEDSMNSIFWGNYNTTLAVLPHMRERRQGNIVNIASIGGKISVPHLLSYSTAKFAVVGFSEGLRAELAREGIRVTTVAPGLMRTGSTINTIMKGKTHNIEYTLFTLLDTLPFTSISAQRAAQQIVAAIQRGSAEIVISIQAQLATRFHGLFPGTTTNILSLVNRLLPTGEGTGTASYSGKQSETPITRSPLTNLGKEASLVSTYVGARLIAPSAATNTPPPDLVSSYVGARLIAPSAATNTPPPDLVSSYVGARLIAPSARHHRTIGQTYTQITHSYGTLDASSLFSMLPDHLFHM